MARVSATSSALALSILAVGCTNSTKPDGGGGIGINPVTIVDDSPAWSPDSTTIAFHRAVESEFGPPGLYLMDLVADSTYLLAAGDAQFPTDLRFSPDGRSIAAIVGSGLVMFSVPLGAMEFVPVSTANPSQPDWAPGGQALVYNRAFEGTFWVVDLVASTEARLEHGGTPVGGAYPRWSPDGRAIAFSQAGTIQRVSSQGDSLVTLASPPQGNSFRHPRWINDGSLILFNELGPRAGMRVVASDGSWLEEWPGNIGDSEAISPDSKRVVVQGIDEMDPEGKRIVLFVQDLADPDGSTLMQLTFFAPP